jgi:hypothetical protein
MDMLTIQTYPWRVIKDLGFFYIKIERHRFMSVSKELSTATDDNRGLTFQTNGMRLYKVVSPRADLRDINS